MGGAARADYDLVAIGGGSAGLVVGEYGARLGARVAIVEANRLGGDCTWQGCVPSKALLATAHVAALMRRADRYGLTPADPNVELGRVMDRVRALQGKIFNEHDRPDLLRAQGCEVIVGRAEFISPREIAVGGERIRARRFCIATGSRPAVPPIPGLDTVPTLTNETIWTLRELPRRLLVLGGGPIGIELGQAMARLGSAVTLVEQGDHLLSKDEPEIADLLRCALEEEGLTILTGATVARVEAGPDGCWATVEVGDEQRRVPFDKLLVAAGRQPNVENLGLDAAGIRYDPKKGIQVDATLRTTNPRVYACGDVNGAFPFTHMAAYEAALVLRNALFPFASKTDYTLAPWATFSDPAVARVGLTEAEARARHRWVHVYRFPFDETDRAIVDRETQGMVKLVCAGPRRKIVGAHIIGPAAGELIHEFIVAMRAGLTALDIASTIHVYPTLSQAALAAAQRPMEGWLRNPLVKGGLKSYLHLQHLAERAAEGIARRRGSAPERLAR